MTHDGRRTARPAAQRSGRRGSAALARDWITLWQSELAALAVDREAQETWHVLLSLWAGGRGRDDQRPAARGGRMSLPRHGNDVPPGPLLRRGPRPLLLHLTLAMLKSSSLRDRVAELERRLAGLEQRRRR